MLIQFSFKNYKSFRNEAILDMSADKITEHSDRLISVGNEKLLPTAAIYGANASGKSNVIEAMRFMVTYVLDSFGYGGDALYSSGNKAFRTPFLFDCKSKSEPSSFEMYFIMPADPSEKTYNYGFSIGDDGVLEEWLNTKAKTSNTYKEVFYRKDNKLEFTGITKKQKENIEISLEKEVLVVSLGSKLKIEMLKDIREWFMDFRVANFGNPYENLSRLAMMPDDFADSKKVQAEVIEYFSTFDPSIVGFDVERNKTEEGEEETAKVFAIHRIADSNDAIGIPLNQESDGTQKMFALYPLLKRTLDSGGVLCVDELNSRLHPLLVRNILVTFLNPQTNRKHAQIIFTTHDAWQLANDLLRRDEIWFTDKDKDGVTTLYSLADFYDEDGVKIRKDENFEKNYLLGKYGAIPDLKAIELF